MLEMQMLVTHPIHIILIAAHQLREFCLLEFCDFQFVLW